MTPTVAVPPSRRDLLRVLGAGLVSGAVTVRIPTGRALAQSPAAAGGPPTPLDVAYAGSMSSLMEGPIKTAAAQRLDVALQGRAAGSNALAQLIVGGSIRPDVVIAVTPGPMQTVLRGGQAQLATPIARTAMVIAYGPRSRFGRAFAEAGTPSAMPWWQVLAQPGLRFGRTDPLTDPQGRNIIFVMQLAARVYGQPDLAQRVLGPALNPAQIFSEPTVEARVQSGELDAASAYKIQPGPFHLPYLTLPDAINLSDDRRRSEYERASVTLNGKTYRPEPLVYYAAALTDAPHPTPATAFARWLTGPEAQTLLGRFSYDPPGDAAPLRA